MKRLFSKINGLLDKEFEITLPGQRAKKQHYTKQRPGYTNPFKHQQELEAQRQQAIRQKQLEAIQRLKDQQELQMHLEALKKVQQKPVAPVKPQQLPPAPVKHSQPVASPIPTTHTVQQQHISQVAPVQKPVEALSQPLSVQPIHIPAPQTQPAEPAHHNVELTSKTQKKDQSILNKKFEFTLKKPTIKKPSFMKKPSVKIPKLSVQKPAIKAKLPSFQNAHKYKKQITITIAVITGITITGAVFSINKPSQPKQVESIKTQNTQQDEAVDPKIKLINAVQKRTQVPENETPEVATVDDADKLRDQDFFRDAQNGDKILLYRVNKKAFLYRPSTDEVLVQAPLVYQNEEEIIATGAATTASNLPPQPEPKHGKILVEPQDN